MGCSATFARGYVRRSVYFRVVVVERRPAGSSLARHHLLAIALQGT